MPSNPHRPGNRASSSFSPAEIDAVAELFRVLRRGGDPSVVMRADAFRGVEQKFAHMQVVLVEQRRRAS